MLATPICLTCKGNIVQNQEFMNCPKCVSPYHQECVRKNYPNSTNKSNVRCVQCSESSKFGSWILNPIWFQQLIGTKKMHCEFCSEEFTENQLKKHSCQAYPQEYLECIHCSEVFQVKLIFQHEMECYRKVGKKVKARSVESYSHYQDEDCFEDLGASPIVKSFTDFLRAKRDSSLIQPHEAPLDARSDIIRKQIALTNRQQAKIGCRCCSKTLTMQEAKDHEKTCLGDRKSMKKADEYEFTYEPCQ